MDGSLSTVEVCLSTSIREELSFVGTVAMFFFFMLFFPLKLLLLVS